MIDRIYKDIIEAKTLLKGVIHLTPLDFSNTLSKMTGGEIYLKLENLQKTGSFKVRGAYYKISKLIRRKKVKGVVAASAGNHAQGVAYAASKANVKAKIVMPIFTPLAKVMATESYGAEVILHGRIFDESYDFAKKLAEEEGLDLIPPFEDPEIIAGQGTIGLEILENLDDIDTVIVPIGGGGLISGISIALKKKLGDRIQVIGVQSEEYPSMYNEYKGEALKPKHMYTIAEGIAVKKPGKLTGSIIKKLVDNIVLVSDDAISRAIFLLLERGKILAEGAGAASVAALLENKVDAEGKKVVAIISGGNLNMTTLTRIISRELIRLKRLIKLRGRMPDRPGALSEVLSMLASANINVIDVSSERYDPFIPPSEAEVNIVIEVRSQEVITKLIDDLKEKGFEFFIED